MFHEIFNGDLEPLALIQVSEQIDRENIRTQVEHAHISRHSRFQTRRENRTPNLAHCVDNRWIRGARHARRMSMARWRRRRLEWERGW